MAVLSLLIPLVVAAPTIIWSSPASVGQGASARFETKGLRAGVHTTLVTRVVCEVKDGGRRKRWREHVHPLGDVPFGVEFRVFVGAQEFPAGAGEVRSPVRVDSENPVVRIEDRSSPPTGRTRCRLTFVAFESL